MSNIHKLFPGKVEMDSKKTMNHSAFLYEGAGHLLMIANNMRYGAWRNQQKGLTPRDTAILSNQLFKFADDMFKQHLNFESERVEYLKRIKHPLK